jgi:predicted TPR repeat methyltransferase
MKKETLIKRSEQVFLNPSLTYPTYITLKNLKSGLEKTTKYARGKLLDLGCGIKPYQSIFNKHIDSYYGVDMKETAKSNYADLTNADFYADICDTGLKSCSFDTLLSTQVLEHIYDTKKYLIECNRLLVKGGHAIFTIPQTYEVHARPFDYYRFTEYSLRSLFEENGFKIIKLYPLEGAYAAMQQIKIVSVVLGFFNHKKSNLSIFHKFTYKILQYIFVPYFNLKAMLLDKYHPNQSLCLNYLLVAIKN